MPPTQGKGARVAPLSTEDAGWTCGMRQRLPEAPAGVVGKCLGMRPVWSLRGLPGTLLSGFLAFFWAWGLEVWGLLTQALRWVSV